MISYLYLVEAAVVGLSPLFLRSSFEIFVQVQGSPLAFVSLHCQVELHRKVVVAYHF